jgi:ATP-binding protein involved in chromosome partitioning
VGPGPPLPLPGPAGAPPWAESGSAEIFPLVRPPDAGGRRVAKTVIAVGSGKGGVGKSTVSLNLALALAQTANVGLLDADFYAPDIPVMLNLTRTKDLRSWPLWTAGGPRIEPLELHGIQVMSAGFLLAEHQVFPAAEQTLPAVIHQLLHDVVWTDLDYLVIDLPPGTADLQQHLFRLTLCTGAILVVTPQDVAHLDAKKLVALLREGDTPVLGAIENMSAVECPRCGNEFEVFPHVRSDRSIWETGVECLGRIPLDPVVAETAEQGRPLVLSHPDSREAQAFHEVAERTVEAVRRLGEGS